MSILAADPVVIGRPARAGDITIARYTSIVDVPVAVWDGLASTTAVGLESGHLRAVEASGINDLHPHYLIGSCAGEAVGIASCFAFDMDLTKLTTATSPEVLAAVKEWRPDFMRFRLLEVGHLASLGATIEAPGEHREAFLGALGPTLDELARIEGADLIVVRDIPVERYPDFHAVRAAGYQPVLGFPIARLALRWPDFDGYLAALKHKKRQRIRRVQDALHAPGISVEVIDDYAPHADRLAALWRQVAERHGEYEHEVLTPAYFEAMARHLPGRSHVVAIKLDGEIVAFGLGLVGDGDYFGVAEGIDGSVRDDYALYPNLFLEVIRVACDLGKTSLNLGITTYDAKTSLGAELHPVVFLVKAVRDPDHSAAYAELFRTGIPQPENRHRAFASSDPATVAARPQPADAARLFADPADPADPFVRPCGYTRADVARVAGLYPFRPVFESAQEPVVVHDGRPVVMLGTNCYLGLATHPRITAAASAALARYGSGCSGSPMLNGTLDLHVDLADRLARFLGKDDALVCSTGYQTNVGVVSALAGRDGVVVMDERSHASLIDGARLAGATVVRYRHADTAALAEALERRPGRRTLVVTDSLFSMEGTVVDLPEIVRLVRARHARLLLDESHAIGVMGPGGRGVAEHFGMLDQVDLVMGTMSKSLASIGGFVAGDRKVIDTLRHTARAHLFSASLPPASVAAALAALGVVEAEPERRRRLLANARFLAAGLRDLGYRVDDHGNAILPVFCGDELLTLAAYHRLLDGGVFVNPVTHPAVPRNQELLRVSLMATHTEEMLRHALDVFAAARTPTWPAGEARP
ncbi:aminotransferase class I/II-fold pyridoxal phosphate-dependent enzyme [Propionicicella superfundia]|uniref:aminotransferase class I/II-fold pyridoxal phosphate-dependent enzyme n=1 Tax=Propionicicella superfundia TaxID=348582 RepID=UPI000413F99B|nr:aminotransferase class I/II-fold pyridoxal phosphate-dependent enzyme [Propionicicella superfundia]